MNLQQKKAWDFLTRNRLATIATISSEEIAPQASFVYYFTDENYHIYIVTAKDSRKFKNILKNSKVALVVAQEMDPLVLQIEGTANVVEDVDKRHHLSGKYLEITNSNTKTPNWPPVMKLSIDEGYIFIEIKVTNFKFSDFTETESFIIQGTSEDWK